MELKRAALPFRMGGNGLKLTAAAAMAVDHVGAALVENGVFQVYNPQYAEMILKTDWGRAWFLADFVMRCAGRIAFPIFCFLLIEGFFHTGSLRRYALRLLAFALVSEMPFNLAFFNNWMAPEGQNVFFTLFIGLLTVEGINRAGKSLPGRLFCAVSGCMAAELLRTDYAAVGVLLIICFYMVRTGALPMWALAVILAVLTIDNLGAACLAVIPISLYDGSRGRGGWKYAFYWFYPAHILALFLIRYLIMGIPLVS